MTICRAQKSSSEMTKGNKRQDPSAPVQVRSTEATTLWTVGDAGGFNVVFVEKSIFVI